MAKDPAPMRTANETRLSFEAPIYEMEARLGEMEVQYAKNRAAGDTTKIAEQIRRLRRELAAAQARDLFQSRPLANCSGFATPAAPPDPRLPRSDLRAVSRAARRPRLWRRPGDRHGPCPPRRHQGDVRRPPEGEEPRRAQGLPLRLRPPRGLSQGPQEDAAGRQVWAADHLVHRHARRLSGNHRRGARPGRDHRREPAWP